VKGPLEPWDNDTGFGQLVSAPDGKRYLITGVHVYGTGGPAFIVVEGDHPVARRLLRYVNPILMRLQRPRSEQTAHIEVCRVEGKKSLEYLMGMEASDIADAHRKAKAIAQDIAAGTFNFKTAVD
jgi:hypothetical protein